MVYKPYRLCLESTVKSKVTKSLKKKGESLDCFSRPSKCLNSDMEQWKSICNSLIKVCFLIYWCCTKLDAYKLTTIHKCTVCVCVCAIYGLYACFAIVLQFRSFCATIAFGRAFTQKTHLLCIVCIVLVCGCGTIWKPFLVKIQYDCWKCIVIRRGKTHAICCLRCAYLRSKGYIL